MLLSQPRGPPDSRKRFHKRFEEDIVETAHSAICPASPGFGGGLPKVLQSGLSAASGVDTVIPFTLVCGKRFHVMDKGWAMAINGREVLLGAGGLAAAATAGGVAAGAPGRDGGGDQAGGGGQAGAVTLALAWWGNPTRNKNTQAMIDT